MKIFDESFNEMSDVVLITVLQMIFETRTYLC